THTPTVGIFFATVPFRYTPRYELIHHIVMNANASIPSVAQILTSIEHALSLQA
ncbi:MAG: glycosyltransferase family 9 protein, partial [Enterovibrio sp.]